MRPNARESITPAETPSGWEKIDTPPEVHMTSFRRGGVLVALSTINGTKGIHVSISDISGEVVGDGVVEEIRAAFVGGAIETEKRVTGGELGLNVTHLMFYKEKDLEQ